MNPKKFRESCSIDIPEWNSIIEKMLKEYAEQQVKLCNLHDVSGLLPTTKELREARELYELQVKSNSMLNKPVSKHWQEGVEWILSRIIESNNLKPLLSAGICDTCIVPKMINSGDGRNEPFNPVLYCDKMNTIIEPEPPEGRRSECVFYACR